MPLVALGGYFVGLRSTLVASQLDCWLWLDLYHQLSRFAVFCLVDWTSSLQLGHSRVQPCLIAEACGNIVRMSGWGSYSTRSLWCHWNPWNPECHHFQVISCLPFLGACSLALLPTAPWVLEGGILALWDIREDPLAVVVELVLPKPETLWFMFSPRLVQAVKDFWPSRLLQQ